MADLVFVETKPVTGRIVPLLAGTTIGREGTDVVLPDPEVSRRHARMCTLGADPGIEDLGSTNGTWVNEQLVDEPVALAEGDSVRFGHTIWHVRSPSAATRVARAAAAD